MSFIELLLQPVFEILNFRITIPFDFEGTTISFSLRMIFTIIFIAYLISIIWTALMGTEHID